MKKFLIAITGLILLVSCNDGMTVAGTSDDNHAERNTETSKEIYNAIRTGDASKLDTLLTDDVVDHNGGNDGSDVVGKDSVKHYLSQIHTYFDNFNVDHLSEATSADGNYHFAMVRMRGKAKANPWGMPVGMEMDDTVVDVRKLRDGKTSEHWGFLSWEDINQMMGQMQGGQQPAAKDTTRRN
ncbi:MAG: nuclear transport factor 2 family protein [Chitinophagaceae bacterium]|nr:nuclear transport factor 2 family protein [Chitinophagaceae bacterium]